MRTRERVAALLAAGWNVTAVARELGVSAPTVCYHARQLGYAPSEKYSRRYDWAEVQRYYDEGHSISECQERFGFARESWNQARRRGEVVSRAHPMPLERLLVPDMPRSRWNLKLRLLNAGLMEERCEECGLTDWRGRPLSMELHHCNGDGRDNRLENLALLCPNCHSQTENFARRTRRLGNDREAA